MDSVKPLDTRRGWTADDGRANRERFEDLISAGWDLVIVDEAHRLGGSTDQVAGFKLGQGLPRPRRTCCCSRQRLIRARPTPSAADVAHRRAGVPGHGKVPREQCGPM